MSVKVLEIELCNPTYIAEEERYRLIAGSSMTPTLTLTLVTIPVDKLALPMVRVGDIKRPGAPRFIPMSNIKYLRYDDSKLTNDE